LARPDQAIASWFRFRTEARELCRRGVIHSCACSLMVWTALMVAR
jgi:hypothetical protein